MKLKACLGIILTSLAVGQCFAQTAETPPNPRRVYVQKLQDCRKQAADQHLKGEEQHSFIAACMKR